ncbi:RNA polymerase sigma factor [Spongiivirga citrea]|uniref:Sigma-70 family RNA polymerase sigma factor n=1 Tax=Spongiivirga citrea TaxID=1481457 RepID=A0A6M0CJ50_9FLAO|nr:RNA polymerase sigma factor [Spongiivirga citrea]NER16024.1 sigma-70 family RNA polymerase sigma factor [Spongiivirga citrea]
MTNQEDQFYITKILEGDSSYYTHLVNRYKNLVYSIVLRMLKNEDDAHEVAQDVFVKVYTSLASFKGDAKFSTWIYKIAYHKCLDALKKKKRNFDTVSIDATYEIGIDQVENGLGQLETAERKEIINKAILSLKEDYAAILTLYYFEELSLKEITKVVGGTLDNVKIKLYRGRKMLFGILKKQLDPETLAIYERGTK